jgi:uncharacterized protein (TIGR02391 family)
MAVTTLAADEPELSAGELRAATARFRRRIAELTEFDPDKLGTQSNQRSDPEVIALSAAIDEALSKAFGYRTPAYKRYQSAVTLDTTARNYAHPVSHHEIVQGIHTGKTRAVVLLNQALSTLEERLLDLGEQPEEATAAAKVLRAYEGLDLHPEIARAANQLYRDGHYSNAIEDAVKALNDLVRLRSGTGADGTSLMETVFSPNKPVLRFNELKDQTDKDEQKGFMMMFSGAVAGLRNPRAHRLIKDDAERALEFIAYISLLAKLLDGAKK